MTPAAGGGVSRLQVVTIGRVVHFGRTVACVGASHTHNWIGQRCSSLLVVVHGGAGRGCGSCWWRPCACVVVVVVWELVPRVVLISVEMDTVVGTPPTTT